jgi:ATP-dependent DNA ligase
MTLEILYKRAKSGAVVFWEIMTEDESDSTTVITKRSGQLGTTSPIQHQEVVQTGKNIGKSNETTPKEQAEAQAKSDWTKKLDDGYMTLEALSILKITDGYQVEDGFFMDLGKVLTYTLPKYNSDANGQPKPMLATCWTKVKNITYPCYIQPKLDGVRCLMVVSNLGDGPEIKFLSRSGKEYTTLDHIENDVLAACWVENNVDANFILDGEIYSDEISFQEIIQAVKKQCPNSLKLKFRAYDIVNDEPQHTRRHSFANIVDAINSPYIVELKSAIAISSENVKEYHDTYVQEGHEGAMLRLPNGTYGQGQRSRELLKVKEFQDAEFECVGLGTGQREEDLLACCETKDGKSFNAKFTGTREYKAELKRNWDNKPKMVTIKFFGYTTDGLPRFPIAKGVRDYD